MPTLEADWDAEGQAYSNGGTISTIVDSVGAHNLSLGGGGPIWRSGASGFGPNGKACMVFNGTSDWLAVPNFLSGSAKEIWVAFYNNADPTTGSPASPIGDWGSHGSTEHTPFTDGTFYNGWGSNARKTTVNPIYRTDQWTLMRIQSTASFWSQWLTSGLTWATISNTVGWGTAAKVGKSQSNFFAGRVARIRLHNAILTSAQALTEAAVWATYMAGDVYTPTVYNGLWRDNVNVTKVDGTGEITKSGGAGGSYDASAQLAQVFDGYYHIRIDATVATNSTLAFGIHATNTAYLIGAVTVASLLAAWEVTGGNAIVKESNTTRFTQAGISVGDILSIDLSADGALMYSYNGTVVYVSTAIGAGTIQNWRPYRVVATLSAASASFNPVTIQGNSREYMDGTNSASNVLVEQPVDILEESASITNLAILPDNMNGTLGPGTSVPTSHGYLG